MRGAQIIRVKRTAWLTFALIWVVATFLSSRVLGRYLGAAILTGLGVALLHWVALLVHHMGHALAARSTGYPMVGVLMWWALATSLYPRDEPDLPASTHIRRAIGGPSASLAFSALAGLIAWVLRAQGYASWALVVFVALDSLVVFGLGSLIPLGFNDGSTLIRWLRARSQGRAA